MKQRQKLGIPKTVSLRLHTDRRNASVPVDPSQTFSHCGSVRSEPKQNVRRPIMGAQNCSCVKTSKCHWQVCCFGSTNHHCR